MLVGIHRWLGIGLGPFVAMWFATGIVMHFVPFPSLSESQRVAGLSTLNLGGPVHGPADAIRASGLTDVGRLRLIQRADGPVYVSSSTFGWTAQRAADLAPATVRSQDLALSIGMNYARQRGKAVPDPAIMERVNYDQWTVAGHYQRHRPLYHLALADPAGTEIYISSTTGEVVLDTTRWQRWCNLIGSVAHWVYAPVLRSKPELWSATVRWLSFAALVLVVAGAGLGIARVRIGGGRPASPYPGMHRWHHVLGLSSLVFVTTWIVSGFLSMDDGVLFSTGRPTASELAAISGEPPWDRLMNADLRTGPLARELEWFAFDGRLFRREITAPNAQHMTELGQGDRDQTFLPLTALGPVARRLGAQCGDPAAIGPDDPYALASVISGSPVYRIACGDLWYDIDAANGALLQTIDGSRRAYRWLVGGFHTLDFPALATRPMLRTALIVCLCGIGLVFSLTGIVIGARRLRRRA